VSGERARLRDLIPPRDDQDPGAVLDRFLEWVAAQGLEPYPEQEQAILELFAGRHVVLSTPTGSGKSLVAQALHWKALCEGARSFYTAPVKALVSEKFFAWCDEFGPERVGMLTGDASINRDAPIVCCTTEVLANMALRQGDALAAPYVVLDEFHYYDDRERGAAWQIPLITLPRTLFLLMSATLGNTAPIEARLSEFTRRGVAHVHSDRRPVPLDYDYRDTPLHETLEDLVRRGLSPVYVVNFTQRECIELAQGATSSNFADRDDRHRIAEAVGDFRFDTPFGKDLRRLVAQGIGVHHAGLLPKYRLLVERLAQQGLLYVVFGTDTLGVGVNIPIRTVVFNKLSKWNGEKTALLSVREFRQIAGRAGRKGFDARGLVVCQAPEHVIANRRLEAKAKRGGKRVVKQRPPPGFVAWNEATFDQLTTQPPEALRSRFDVRHGMLVSVLRREPRETDAAPAYRALIDLVNRSHETDAAKRRLRRHAARLFRALRRAGILEIVEASFGPPEVRVSESLQTDFSLHQTLSLWLHEAATALDRESPDYALVLTSLVEAAQEDPDPILREQTWKARRARMAELAAEGVDYDTRRRQAEEVSYPRPEQDFIRESFALFAEKHPWVESESVRPKSIAREMVEGFQGFNDYVRDYSLARCEGLLLRYLSQVHNALVKSVPDAAKTEEVFDVIAFLRTLVARVDSSLIEAWESLLEPAPAAAEARPALRFDLAKNARALRARVRQELLGCVAALARGEYEDAVSFLHADPDDPWTPTRLEEALAPFLAEYGHILLTPEARRAHWTHLAQKSEREWDVAQVLLDPHGDHLWALHGEIDLRQERDPEAPLVRLRRIGV
jgi:superfamily II DNA/RNA helicase